MVNKKGFATRAIHSGSQKNQYGALNNPIYQTSTFVFDNSEQGGKRFAGEEEGYVYSRSSNPSMTQVEEKIADLENAEAAVVTGSGMGAITSSIWVSVSGGDHIIASKTLYGCTFSFLKNEITRFGVEVTFIDMENLEEYEKAFKDNTKLVYLETPANPNMQLIDIEKISKIAHDKIESCIVMVDNTFATPYIQRPLDLGADVVVHSATKYINGHGDVIAGFAVGKKDFIDNVRGRGLSLMTGSAISPFDCFLIARGLKTLEIRMKSHCENAMKVAEYLENHEKIEKVSYPGLKSFEQYELAQKQMALPGAMLSFEVKGGMESGKILMDNVEMCKLAVSLGDAETLIQHPASMTHAKYPREERLKAGISDGLVRLSVGLENPEDIIEDLKNALELV